MDNVVVKYEDNTLSITLDKDSSKWFKLIGESVDDMAAKFQKVQLYKEANHISRIAALIARAVELRTENEIK